MHFFPMYLETWVAHTAHLTLEEEGAYHRLLHHYYLTERPLPNDINLLAKKTRLRGQENLITVVLEEFFLLREDAWVNQRAELELEKIREKSEKARASAARRWAKNDANAMPTQCEGNAINTNTNINNNINNNKTKTIAPVRRSKVKTQFPVDLDLSIERQSAALNYWQSKNRDDLSNKVAEIWDQFKTYCQANAKTYANWDAAWKTWYSNSVKFERNSNASSVRNFETKTERLDRATAEYMQAHANGMD